MSELEARVTELERQIEIFKKLFKVLGDHIKNHQEITEYDTKLFNNLDARVKALEKSK